MAKGLSYADAAMLLGGSGPIVAALDRLLGTALIAVAAAGTGGALNLFDAKTETVRISGLLTTAVRQQVHGASRLSRTERLQAAHSVLAVSAFFEAIDDLTLPLALRDIDLRRADQTALLGVDADGGWVGALLRMSVPAPDPALPFRDSTDALHDWYRSQAGRLAEYLDGLAVMERLNETDRRGGAHRSPASSSGFSAPPLLERLSAAVRRVPGVCRMGLAHRHRRHERRLAADGRRSDRPPGDGSLDRTC